MKSRILLVLAGALVAVSSIAALGLTTGVASATTLPDLTSGVVGASVFPALVGTPITALSANGNNSVMFNAPSWPQLQTVVSLNYLECQTAACATPLTFVYATSVGDGMVTYSPREPITAANGSYGEITYDGPSGLVTLAKFVWELPPTSITLSPQTATPTTSVAVSWSGGTGNAAFVSLAGQSITATSPTSPLTSPQTIVDPRFSSALGIEDATFGALTNPLSPILLTVSTSGSSATPPPLAPPPIIPTAPTPAPAPTATAVVHLDGNRYIGASLNPLAITSAASCGFTIRMPSGRMVTSSANTLGNGFAVSPTVIAGSAGEVAVTASCGGTVARKTFTILQPRPVLHLALNGQILAVQIGQSAVTPAMPSGHLVVWQGNVAAGSIEIRGGQVVKSQLSASEGRADWTASFVGLGVSAFAPAVIDLGYHNTSYGTIRVES